MARIILILILTSLVACTTTKNIVGETAFIQEELSSGRIQENVKSIENLSSSEMATINHAINEVNEFNTTYTEFLREPRSFFAFKPEKMHKDYLSLKQRFFEVEQIVERHFDEYDEEGQDTLIKYRDYAYKLDSQIQEYHKERKFLSAIVNSINYTFALVKMVVSLK